MFIAFCLCASRYLNFKKEYTNIYRMIIIVEITRFFVSKVASYLWIKYFKYASWLFNQMINRYKYLPGNIILYVLAKAILTLLKNNVQHNLVSKLEYLPQKLWQLITKFSATNEYIPAKQLVMHYCNSIRPPNIMFLVSV